ncbi:hypothetical protein [Fervidobacterium sp.]
MEFGNTGSFQNNKSDAVERFIRLLIANNELSLARNILEALGKKYNHLLFELEVKAGNYSKAVEIFNFMPKEDQEIYIHIVSNIEKDADRVSESLEKILKEFNEENYPIVIAEVQKVKKEFPQVTEIIAMELLAAIKRDDRKKIDLLYEILSQLDKTHPLLTQVRRRKAFSGNILPAALVIMLVVVVANLIISFINFTQSGGLELSKIEKNLASVEDKLTKYAESTNLQFKNLSESINLLKINLDDISQKLNNAESDGEVADTELLNTLSDKLKLINDKLSAIEKQISKLPKTSSSNKVTYSESLALKKLTDDFAVLKGKLAVIETKIENIKKTESNQATDGLQVELKNIKNRLEKIENTIAEFSNNDATEKDNIRDSLSNLSYKLNELSKQVSLLKEPSSGSRYVDSIPSSNDAFEKRLSDLESTINSLRTELSKLIEKSSEESEQVTSSALKDNSNDSIEKNVRDIENRVASLYLDFESLISQFNDERKTWNSKFSDLNQEIASVKDRSEKFSSDILQMQKEIDELKKKLTELSKSLSKDSSEKAPTETSKIQSSTEDVSKNITFEQIPPLSTPVTKDGNAKENSTVVSQQRDLAQEVIKQTKDLKELFLAGLRFYLEGQYTSAITVFEYLQPRIDNSNVYYKEDVYYYKIMSYISLGQTNEAQKEYEAYKRLYPAGQYMKELSSHFK